MSRENGRNMDMDKDRKGNKYKEKKWEYGRDMSKVKELGIRQRHVQGKRQGNGLGQRQNWNKCKEYNWE
jgi:hypothetical protein